MIALALALGSAAVWGVSDFLGGLAGRKLPLLTVLAVSQAIGLILALAVMPVVAEPLPPGAFGLWAVVSGVADVFGLWALYRGLASGMMGTVAPIAATGAVVPVAYGIATGEMVSGAILIGITIAVAGVAMVACEPDEKTGAARVGRGTGVGLGLLAALGFGIGFAALGFASEGEVQWAVVLNRFGAVAAVALLVIWRRHELRVARGDLPSLAAIGALDAAAISLFAWASTHGALGLVAAIGSLYPIVTVGLARVVLGERLGLRRRAGAFVVVAGAAMLTFAASGHVTTSGGTDGLQAGPSSQLVVEAGSIPQLTTLDALRRGGVGNQ